MAGQRTLPGLKIRAYWTVGSNNWEQQLNPDLRRLSILTQCRALSHTTNLPESPADGAIYIVPKDQEHAHAIAARDNGQWVYIAPEKGFLVYIEDKDKYFKWNGTRWGPIS